MSPARSTLLLSLVLSTVSSTFGCSASPAPEAEAQGGAATATQSRTLVGVRDALSANLIATETSTVDGVPWRVLLLASGDAYSIAVATRGGLWRLPGAYENVVFPDPQQTGGKLTMEAASVEEGDGLQTRFAIEFRSAGGNLALTRTPKIDSESTVEVEPVSNDPELATCSRFTRVGEVESGTRTIRWLRDDGTKKLTVTMRGPKEAWAFETGLQLERFEAPVLVEANHVRIGGADSFGKKVRFDAVFSARGDTMVLTPTDGA